MEKTYIELSFLADSLSQRVLTDLYHTASWWSQYLLIMVKLTLECALKDVYDNILRNDRGSLTRWMAPFTKCCIA